MKKIWHIHGCLSHLASEINNVSVNLNRSKNITQSFFSKEISESQVYNAKNQSTNKKSCDNSGKSNYFLKKFSFVLVLFLAKFFHKISDQECFPSKMKYTRITPAHKSGSLKEAGSFRTIALIDANSKVFEKIIHQKRYSFLEKFKILNDHYLGFRMKRSTFDSISIVSKTILEANNNIIILVALFLYFRKAFKKFPKTRTVPKILFKKYVC